MVELSVIIPSYNHPQKIRQCIRSVLAQDFSRPYEVIVVDSSSESNQLELEKFCATDERITLIKRSQQTFPGIARNIGVEAASGPLLAMIDSDCVAEKDWLTNIYTNLTDNVILTGVVQNGTPESMLGTCSWLVEFNHFLEPSRDKQEIPGAATCNFAIKKQEFERVGGFTGDRGFEDILFCEKFKKLGGKIYQLRNIRISHINKTELADIRANQWMLGRFSAIIRREQGMPPQVVFKYPVLAFLLVGFRYVSIFSRVMRDKYFLRFLLYTPFIIYFLIQWSIGFYRGAKYGRNEERE
jgi:glycosyltransferase involved in cell wall biosynthesis